MPRIITLTTDFGAGDGFAGAMKGVILSLCPAAYIVDITHGIPPQDVLSAAFALEAAASYFPAGTIHVAVVDPGVGSARAALCVETRQHFFIGPDNGIFDLACAGGRFVRALRLREAEFVTPRSSATFHGRDVFAPAAARLATGAALESFADPVPEIVCLPLAQPVRQGADLLARVIHADRFGNLVTGLCKSGYNDWNRAGGAVEIQIGGRTIAGICATYSDVPEGALLAYFGSGGRLEIALRDGSALEFFQWTLRGARGREVLLKKLLQ